MYVRRGRVRLLEGAVFVLLQYRTIAVPSHKNELE